MLKRFMFVIFTLATITIAMAQTVLINWNFENADKRTPISNDATFQSSPYTADNGIAANADVKIIKTVGRPLFSGWVQGSGGSGTYACNTNGWDNGSGIKYWEISFTSTGYSSLTLSSKQYSSSTGPRDFKVQYSLNETEWTDVPGTALTVATNWTAGVLNNVSLPADCNNKATVYLRWIMTSNTSVGGSTVGSAGTDRIDDISISGVSSFEPTLHLSTASLAPFFTTVGTPSAAQSYHLSGSNLTADITIAIPAGFEISTDDGITYYSGSVTVASTFDGNIFVRLTGSSIGTFTGNLVHSSSGAANVNLSVSGTVSSTIITPPTIQASGIIGYPAYTSITIEWTPGNGAYRVVKINTANSFTTPADGTSPAASTSYSGSGEQVIYNGATEIIDGEQYNGCTVTNLTPNTTYWFRIYEYNGTGTDTKYLSTTAADNPKSVTTTSSSGSGYYADIYGYGTTLKGLLHNLIKTTHTTQYSYDAVTAQMKYTDEDPANSNNVIEIYTGWSVNKDSYGSGVTDWNKEHTWSKSHGNFGDSPPAGTDLHHLRPCDSTVNSRKSNKDFAAGGSAVIDNSPPEGYTGETGCFNTTNGWEPRDADKGDVARMIMYMAVRYEGDDSNFNTNLELVDYIYSDAGSNQPYYGKLATLLQWHVQDPPDAREMQRNNRIAERQGNRNPFIDFPGYAARIWSPCPLYNSSVTVTGFTGNWSTPLSATDYYLQIATDSLFTNIVSGYGNLDVNLVTSYSVSGLIPGNTYYYRLRSYFVDDYSMFSPYLAVTLQNLPTVTALAATNISAEGFTANWQPASGISEYRFDLSTNNDFSSFVNGYNNYSVSSTGLTVSSLLPNSTYYYRVRSYWSGYSGPNSNVITVTTLDTAPPSAPANLSVTGIGTDIRLEWNAVNGATSYAIYASEEPYGTFSLIADNVTTNYKILSGEALFAKRFYYVKAKR